MLCLGSRCLTFLAIASAPSGASAFAQTPNGRISGVVRDSGGVVREAATVRATNNATPYEERDHASRRRVRHLRRGFKMGPALGEHVAALVQAKAAVHPLFAYERLRPRPASRDH